MSAHWPYSCTGRITFVLGVRASSSLFGSMVKVRGSTSTKTGLAPAKEMAEQVGTAVSATVATSSPGSTPQARRARWMASVPEPTPTQWAAPQ